MPVRMLFNYSRVAYMWQVVRTVHIRYTYCIYVPIERFCLICAVNGIKMLKYNLHQVYIINGCQYVTTYSTDLRGIILNYKKQTETRMRRSTTRGKYFNLEQWYLYLSRFLMVSRLLIPLAFSTSKFYARVIKPNTERCRDDGEGLNYVS